MRLGSVFKVGAVRIARQQSIAKSGCNAIVEATQKFCQCVNVTRGGGIGTKHIQNGPILPEGGVKQGYDAGINEGQGQDAPAQGFFPYKNEYKRYQQDDI